MPAVRGCGFTDAGDFWVEPSWVPEGMKTGLSAVEIATIDDTGAPLATLLFHLQTLIPSVTDPVIKDPTKAANAKAQTLQIRLDGLMGSDGSFHAGQVVIAVDKATQGITVNDP